MAVAKVVCLAVLLASDLAGSKAAWMADEKAGPWVCVKVATKVDSTAARWAAYSAPLKVAVMAALLVLPRVAWKAALMAEHWAVLRERYSVGS